MAAMIPMMATTMTSSISENAVLDTGRLCDDVWFIVGSSNGNAPACLCRPGREWICIGTEPLCGLVCVVLHASDIDFDIWEVCTDRTRGFVIHPGCGGAA